MKEPKYTGPKKGYASIWIGLDKANYQSNTYQRNRSYMERFRVIHSKTRRDIDVPSKFTYNDMKSIVRGSDWMFTPCWCYGLCRTLTEEKAIHAMKDYDKANGRETVFLGYVKDVE